MESWKKWRGSHQGFGLAMMLSCAVIVVTFVVCWRIHRRDEPGSPGFPDSLAFFIAATYAPVIGATFVGYRDAVVSMFPQEGALPTPLPLRGAPIFYVLALSGVAVALSSVVYVATGVDDAVAKWFTASSAAYWGATVGYTFDKLFKRFTVAPVPAAPQQVANPNTAGAGSGQTSG